LNVCNRIENILKEKCFKKMDINQLLAGNIEAPYKPELFDLENWD